MSTVTDQQRLFKGYRKRLLAWYDARHRDLPWRAGSDAYHIWVSEIMLQQTRVETVVPYFLRWVDRFPTVDALATADLHDVLVHWEGLGYYARARNLHSGARLVRERHAGRVPDDIAELRELPGVGEYTAGAIASIAYGKPAPAIDGNVKRVLSRLLDTNALATIRRAAAELVDPQRPGDFNQALMELGATLCSPRKPACGQCPLARVCAARRNHTIPQRPAAAPRRAVPHLTVNTLVLTNESQVLLAQHAPHGLLGGTWHFPEVSAAHLPAGSQSVGTITHAFSHRRVTYVVYRADGSAFTGDPATDQRWVEIRNLSGLPLSAAQRKIQKLAGLG